jgi:hypothetical protein
MQPKDFGMRERRATQRYGLKLAMAFRMVPGLKESDALLGETRNISTRGMYFTTGQPLALNEVLDFSLTFPGLAHGADVLVTGRARVLRVVQNSETASEPAGVAVVTEEYHILEPDVVA